MDLIAIRRKLMMGAKGKSRNLFNINASFQAPSDTGSSNAKKRIFTPYTYCAGIAANNYYVPSRVTYSLENETLTVSQSTAYGVGFALPLTPGTYRISCDSAAYQRVNIGYYQSDGTWLFDSNSVINYNSSLNDPFVVPNDCAITVIVFAVSTTNQTATYSHIQVEAGDTITPYVPF